MNYSVPSSFNIGNNAGYVTFKCKCQYSTRIKNVQFKVLQKSKLITQLDDDFRTKVNEQINKTCEVTFISTSDGL